MYIKLLNEVIKEKQGQIEEKEKIKVSNLALDAYIPKVYASDGDKLEIYQEIQEVSTLVELEVFKNKIKDIYGKIPNEVMLLLRKRKIDILSSSIYIESLEETKEAIIILLSKTTSEIKRIGINLLSNLESLARDIIFSFVDNQIKIKLKKDNSYLEKLEKLLVIIDKTCQSGK